MILEDYYQKSITAAQKAIHLNEEASEIMQSIAPQVEIINKTREALDVERYEAAARAREALGKFATLLHPQVKTLRKGRKGKNPASLLFLERDKYYFATSEGDVILGAYVEEASATGSSGTVTQVHVFGPKEIWDKSKDWGKVVPFNPSTFTAVSERRIQAKGYGNPMYYMSYSLKRDSLSINQIKDIRAFLKSDFTGDLLDDAKVQELADIVHRPPRYITTTIL